MAQVKPLKLLPDGNLSQVNPSVDDLTISTVTSNQLTITNDLPGEKIIIQGNAADAAEKLIHVKNSAGTTVSYIDGSGNASFKNISVAGTETIIGNVIAQSDLNLTGDLNVSGDVVLGNNILVDKVTFNAVVDTDLDMGYHNVKNLSDPVDPQDAATMQFVLDNSSAGGWSQDGNILSGSEFFGSLNGKDVIFKRSNIEQMRIRNSSANGTGAIQLFGDAGYLAYEEVNGGLSLLISSDNEAPGSLNPSKNLVIKTGDTDNSQSGTIEIGPGSSQGDTGDLVLYIPETQGVRGKVVIDSDVVEVIGDVIPELTNSYSLGSSGAQWLNVYGANVGTADTSNFSILQNNTSALEINSTEANLNKHLVINSAVSDVEAKVFEVKNSSGVSVAFIDEDGDLTVNNMSVTGNLTVINIEETQTSLTVNGDLTVLGNTTLGDASTDTMSFIAKSVTDLNMNGNMITSLETPTVSGDAANKYYVDTTISTALGTLGTLALPTDGVYGGAGGNISGVDQNDRYEDAFDKVEAILGKLAPAKPFNLSTKSLAISGTYSAYESAAITPTLRSNVIDNTTPLAQTPTGAANGFWDAEEGIISAEVDSVTSGSRTLSAANDVGTYGSLKILSDYDFYAGQVGKELFWAALTAGVQSSTPLSLGSHTYRLLHSKTGNTAVNTFYVDDPQAVTVTGQTITGSGTGKYISGVPSLNTGDTIAASFTVNNAIRQHYNPTRIAAASSTLTNSVNQSLPLTPPTSGDPYSGSISLTVSNSKYGEQTTVACTGYNSKGTTGSANAVSNIRVDTVSNEVRVKSGQGQYPTAGSAASEYGSAFDSTISLVSAGNEELQLLNGLYQFPAGNYTSNLPVNGPNYSAATGGSYSNYRWVTFNLGNKTSVSSVTLTINGGVNLGSTTLISGLLLNIKVDGAIPTNGWIDGNAAYSGVGNPTNDGTAALVIGSSNVATRVITFGATVRTGNVYVRVGIPLASNKRFTNITIA